MSAKATKQKGPNVVFFISTGRCGTQWLASTLSKFYDDVAVVTHEPLGPHYEPSTFFRHFELGLDELRERISPLREHLENIQRVVDQDKLTYIEVGWPIYGVLPSILNHFAKTIGEDRIRLVHLVRNPVDTALSFCNGKWYEKEGEEVTKDDEGRAAVLIKYMKVHQLNPYKDNVFHKQEYQARWSSMDALEKCLFLWLEVNRYAQEVFERFPHIAHHRVRFEDLVNGENNENSALHTLSRFLDLPQREHIERAADTRVDTWKTRFGNALEESAQSQQQNSRRDKVSAEHLYSVLDSHPKVVELARSFGYSDLTCERKQPISKNKLTRPLEIAGKGSALYQSDVRKAYRLVSLAMSILSTLVLLGISESFLATSWLSLDAYYLSKRNAKRWTDDHWTLLQVMLLHVLFLVAGNFIRKTLSDLQTAHRKIWAVFLFYATSFLLYRLHLSTEVWNLLQKAQMPSHLDSTKSFETWISLAFLFVISIHHLLFLRFLLELVIFRFTVNRVKKENSGNNSDYISKKNS